MVELTGRQPGLDWQLIDRWVAGDLPLPVGWMAANQSPGYQHNQEENNSKGDGERLQGHQTLQNILVVLLSV